MATAILEKPPTGNVYSDILNQHRDLINGIEPNRNPRLMAQFEAKGAAVESTDSKLGIFGNAQKLFVKWCQQNPDKSISIGIAKDRKLALTPQGKGEISQALYFVEKFNAEKDRANKLESLGEALRSMLQGDKVIKNKPRDEQEEAAFQKCIEQHMERRIRLRTCKAEL